MPVCRVCKNEDLTRFLDLGQMPLANSFLKKGQLNLPEPSYPLDVYFCDKCGLMQLGYVVPPDLLFKDYIYFSSLTSDALIKHFGEFARDVVERFSLNSNSFVVEIASNDGILLKPIQQFGVRVLGVDPASNIAKVANANGIETIDDYFSSKLAEKVVKEKGKADVVIAANVIAHINDLHDVFRGIDILLKDSGVFVMQLQYGISFVEKLEYDTTYHEHLSYVTLRPMKEIFSQYNLEPFDVKFFPDMHGNSIRIYAKRKSNSNLPISESVQKQLEYENADHGRIETYIEFGKKVEEHKEKLVKLLRKFKSEGKKIVGYGAAAKGNTLLNYCGIGTDVLDYIVDKSPAKQGMVTPGTHIEVFSTEKLKEDNPDYILILAWNFAKEIMEQQKWYKESGGKFIIPIPEPVIV